MKNPHSLEWAVRAYRPAPRVGDRINWDGVKTTALKELPAGSFYTEPANIIHVVEARKPTMIQASGIGPSGRRFVNPDDNNPK